ncbi:hypothetical protein B0A75_19950 [Flavobacterium oncorhynchi]|uniref:Outer membrane protein beta-barrel domain-containing protein n=1 Tax=Flavobacterium oncorhynchi TaxID=728056 RepID=A0A226HIF4_9FLAO|nr:outer membrane beta-barrel protein [Flavobacterium oncorhynchi]OXA94129.1 hypothetical protein B0A75_19950 [Flavobacterium oncorhynchi]
MYKIFISFFLLSSSLLVAQDRIFIAAELDGGLLTTNYQSLTIAPTSIISGEEQNHNIRVAASVFLEWDNRISFEVGIAQNFRFWSLSGKKPDSNLEIKNNQYFPSAFVGGYYDIPFDANDTNLQFYIGTKFSVDFLNYNSLNGKDGNSKEYVTAETEKSIKFGFNVIPEIGIKGRFHNENIWMVGLKYYHPINGDIINGEIQHYTNNKLTEEISYNSTGQIFSLSFKYGFSI